MLLTEMWTLHCQETDRKFSFFLSSVKETRIKIRTSDESLARCWTDWVSHMVNSAAVSNPNPEWAQRRTRSRNPTAKQKRLQSTEWFFLLFVNDRLSSYARVSEGFQAVCNICARESCAFQSRCWQSQRRRERERGRLQRDGR